MNSLSFKKIELSDLDLFKSYFNNQSVQSFDASFVNSFIYAEHGNIQMASDENALYIIQEWNDYYPFMNQPYLLDNNYDISECIIKGAEYMKSEYGRVNYKFILEKTKASIENSELKCSFHHDINNSEYLYNTSDLITLRGKKYHGKRNHINKLINNYDVEYIKIDETFLDRCMDIERAWISERPVTQEELIESVAIEKLLANYDALGISGCLIRVNGEDVGFSIGELLNGDTVLIHIEKCLNKYDGLYQYINNAFLINEFSESVFVNRAEDMGILGLRKAKESYYPCAMVNKYDMYLDY